MRGGRDLRPFARRSRNLFEIVAEERHILSGAIFQHESKAAGGADAGNGGWRKGKGDAIGNAAELLVDALLESRRTALPALCARPKP